MRIDVLTLFPEMFEGVLGSSILKRAAQDMPQRPAPVSYHLTNIRQYAAEKNGKVDQPPYGGGPGMVIQCQPVWDAVQAVEAQDHTPTMRVVMTPQGRRMEQHLVESLAQQPRLLIISGHYEAIDDRVIQELEPIEKISIGDYILSGGELPAMVLIDAVVRLIPGVLGDEMSTHHESFSSAAGRLFDHPHYTRPQVWRERPVPPVLLSGDHSRIEAWRRDAALERTRQRRPDILIDKAPKTNNE